MCRMADVDLQAILFHGFSDRSRLRILDALGEDKRRVSDVVDLTGLTQSNVSTHLACLHDCGLVTRKRHGREVHYRVADGVTDLLAVADDILGRTGEHIAACTRHGRGRRPELAS